MLALITGLRHVDNSAQLTNKIVHSPRLRADKRQLRNDLEADPAVTCIGPGLRWLTGAAVTFW